jgi:DNA polymerase V
MSVMQVPLNQPIAIQSNPLLLDVCGWSVQAGFPSPAQDHVQRRIDLNEHLIHNKDASYLFKVSGDSMIGVGIFNGDTLIVDRSIEPKHNNIVLGVLNTEYSVKRLYKRGGVVKLVPENPIYPTRIIKEEDDFIVWGVVTAAIRKTW